MKAESENYKALASSFDLVLGAAGELNTAQLLNQTRCFELPAWVKIWQKATCTFVATLTHLKAKEVGHFQRCVQDLLAEVCANSV